MLAWKNNQLTPAKVINVSALKMKGKHCNINLEVHTSLDLHKITKRG